jgi:hypothetical protein
MANYLERVIAAGARVRSTARPSMQTAAIVSSIPVASFPPTSAPANVPPPSRQPSVSMTHPSFAPAPEPSEEIKIGNVANHAQQSDATDTATSAIKAPPERVAQVPVPLSVALARMTSSTRVVAPKGLRAEPLAPVMSKTTSIEVTNMIAAVGGHLRASGSSVAREPDTSSIATESTGPVSARRVAETAPPAGDLDAAAIAPAGTEVVTKSDSTPGALVMESHEVSSGDREPQPWAKTATESEVRPARTESFREVPSLAGKPRPVPDEVSMSRTPLDSFPTAPVLPQPEAKPDERPTEANELSDSQVIGIKPKLVGSVATPLERRAPNRGRITIGRLDVQVNNQRRLPNIASDRAPVVAPRTGYIEALYLERLAMRP